MSAALVVVLSLGIVALVLRQRAIDQRNTAQSTLLANEAVATVGQDFNRAALLGSRGGQDQVDA